jgi:large subunit ribosomal protein L29
MKDKFNDLTYDELQTKHRELTKQYRDLRFDKVLAHVDNPLQMRTLRRKIARVKTIIHEYDTGIRKRA